MISWGRNIKGTERLFSSNKESDYLFIESTSLHYLIQIKRKETRVGVTDGEIMLSFNSTSRMYKRNYLIITTNNKHRYLISLLLRERERDNVSRRKAKITSTSNDKEADGWHKLELCMYCSYLEFAVVDTPSYSSLGNFENKSQYSYDSSSIHKALGERDSRPLSVLLIRRLLSLHFFITAWYIIVLSIYFIV